MHVLSIFILAILTPLIEASPTTESIVNYIDDNGRIKPNAPFMHTMKWDQYLSGGVRSPRRVIVKKQKLFTNALTGYDDPGVMQFVNGLIPTPVPDRDEPPPSGDLRLSTETLNLPMLKIEGKLARIIDPSTGETKKKYKFDNQRKNAKGWTLIYVNKDPDYSLTLEEGGITREGGSIADNGFLVLTIPPHANYIIEDLVGDDRPYYNIIDSDGLYTFEKEGDYSWPKMIPGFAGCIIMAQDSESRLGSEILIYNANGRMTDSIRVNGRDPQIIEDKGQSRAFFLISSDAIRHCGLEGDKLKVLWTKSAREFFKSTKGKTQTGYTLSSFSFSPHCEYIYGFAEERQPDPRGEHIEVNHVMLDRSGNVLMNRLRTDWTKTWEMPTPRGMDTAIYNYYDTMFRLTFLSDDIALYEDRDLMGYPILENGKYNIKFLDLKTQEVIGHYTVQLPEISKHINTYCYTNMVLWISATLPPKPPNPDRQNLEVLQLEVVTR